MGSRLRRLSRSLKSGNNGTPLRVTLLGGAHTALIADFNFEAAPGEAHTQARRPISNWFSTKFRNATNTSVVNAGVIVGSWNNCGFMEIRCHTDNSLIWGINNTFGGGANAILYTDASGFLRADPAAFVYNEVLEQMKILQTTANTTPMFVLEQDGAGDASLNFLLTATAGWSMGVDNSDSDNFKIVTGNTLTGNTLVIDSSGRIGASINPVATTRLLFSHQQNNLNTYGILGHVATNSTANGTHVGIGIWGNTSGSYVTGATETNLGYTAAGYFQASVNNPLHVGTLTNTQGIRILHGITSCGIGGTITKSYGIYIDGRNDDADGTITDRYGVYIDGTGTSGTVTNDWGLYIENSTMNSFMASPLTIGTSGQNPQAKLHVYAGGTAPAIAASTLATFQRNDTTGRTADISIIGGTAGFSSLYLGDQTSETAGSLQYDHTNDRMSLHTGGGQRVLLNSTLLDVKQKIGITGVSTFSAPGGNGEGYFYTTTVSGLVVYGQGSSTDFLFANSAGSSFMQVNTGSNVLTSGGGVEILGNHLHFNGDANYEALSGNGQGKQYADTVLGMTIYGQGSTYDLSFLNTSGSSVLHVPTGTNRAEFFGDIRVYDNDIDTTPQVVIEQDSTGDAALNFLLSATAGYTIGIDNSDSDYFKLSGTNTLAGYIMATNTGGHISFGSAPSTLARLRVFPETNASSGMSGILVNMPGGDVSAPGTNNLYGIQMTMRSDTHDIATGITDSGSREAFRVQCFANSANFEGTLARQIGGYFRTGHTAGTGTISNSIGVLIENLESGNSVVTQGWGIYQKTATVENFFAGNTGFGKAPDAPFHFYSNDTSNITGIIEQDGTGDAALNFLLSATQGYTIGIDNSFSGDRFFMSAGNTVEAAPFFSAGSDQLVDIGPGAGAPNVPLRVIRADTTRTDMTIESQVIADGAEIGLFQFTASNSLSAQKNYARIIAGITDNTATTEDGFINYEILKDGSSAAVFQLTGSELKLFRNDTDTGPMFVLDQDGTGDASITFRLTATSNSVIGIDNSDGDYLKLAGHADSFAAANTYLRMNTVQIAAILDTASQFHIFRNDTSSTALFRLSNAGTGDTYLRWDNGAEEFATGMDYSDGNTFKIQPGSGPLGTTLQGLMISQEGRHAIGNTQNAGSWLYVAGGLETTANATRTTIKAELPRRNVDANETNYYFGFHSEWQAQTFDIANLITDSGSREGFRCEAFVNEAAFLGTLAAQRGAYIRTGHAGSSGAGTITNSIGVFIENLASGAATVTNEWGIYQSSTAAENCFQGNTGFGTNNIGAEVHAYANRADTTNQIRAENDGSGDAMMMFNLTATKQFSIGIDNSDQDSFKINRGTSLGANEDFRIDGSDGTCRISRAIELPVVEVNANTTLGAGNHTCLVNTNAANRVITLPTAASGQYRIYRIKKIDAAANTVTVDANGAETIDGAANTVLSSQYDAVTLQSDGTTWWILSRT
jgi:hypothetical protein